MKPKTLKRTEKILSEMLIRAAFQLSGEQSPGEFIQFVKDDGCIIATYETSETLEQCFISLTNQTIHRELYRREYLFGKRTAGKTKTREPKQNEYVVEKLAVEEPAPEKVIEVKDAPYATYGKVCTRCGAQFENNYKFCTECGLSLKLPAQEEPVIENSCVEEPIVEEHIVDELVVKEPVTTMTPPPPIIEDIEINDLDDLSVAEKLLPTAISAVEERTALIRQVNKYNEPSDLYINPDGTICYPNNVESDCIGRVFDSSLSEDDKDELLDLLYGQLNNVEVYEPSNVLVVHI